MARTVLGSSLQDHVAGVLEQYKGKYVSVRVLLRELGAVEIYMSSETGRKWLRRFGCMPKGGGLYQVPDVVTRSA